MTSKHRTCTLFVSAHPGGKTVLPYNSVTYSGSNANSMTQITSFETNSGNADDLAKSDPGDCFRMTSSDDSSDISTLEFELEVEFYVTHVQIYTPPDETC